MLSKRTCFPRSLRAKPPQEACNIAYGESTSLTRLFYLIRDGLARHIESAGSAEPQYCDFRSGDVVRSMASVQIGSFRVGV